MSAVSAASARPTVVEICSRLLAIDSSNYGARGGSESAVAEYVCDLLRGAGYAPEVLASAPGRTNVLLRVPGSDPGLDGFLVHGHLDVVPAEPEQWSVDPFAGLIQDGYIWGRGATDMKDMVASMLSTLLRWSEEGTGPRRDIVFAFVADEEADGTYGSEWLVENHPDRFAGVAAGISEGGGVPVEQMDSEGVVHRFYPVSTAERGTQHMTVRATGASGHGSRPEAENAVLDLVDAIARVAHHRWPITLIPSTRAYLELTTAALGVESDLSTDEGVEAAIDSIGDLRADVRPASRNSVNPTVLRAGYKTNVIPGVAEAELDVRSVPGTQDALVAEIRRLLGPDITTEFISNQAGVEAPIDSPWFRAITEAITTHDPEAVVVPYCLGGGTDAKAFSRIGIPCYGFAPLGVDPEGRVGSGMHGVDERVPVAALETGALVLQRFLTGL
jgi:acetylornithine deacetylase/succinyl-diaminopimelate desuccinylase-like protein